MKNYVATISRFTATPVEMDWEQDVVVFYEMVPTADLLSGTVNLRPEIASVQSAAGIEMELPEKDEDRILDEIMQKELGHTEQ